jgi:hypothetical protein
MNWFGLVLACLVLGFVSAGSVNAQGASSKPNLSGKWLLESQSEAGIGTINLPASTSVQLEITDSNPEIKIVRILTTPGRKETSPFTYYSDARGEKNPDVGFLTSAGGGSTVEVKSQTKWKKQKLVVQGSFRQRLGAGRYQEVQQVEEWELGADGKTLTQLTTRRFEDRAFDIQAGGRTPPVIIATRPVRFKRIYRRVE